MSVVAGSNKAFIV